MHVSSGSFLIITAIAFALFGALIAIRAHRRGALRSLIAPLVMGLPGLYLGVCGSALHRSWLNTVGLALVTIAFVIRLASDRRSTTAARDRTDGQHQEP